MRVQLLVGSLAVAWAAAVLPAAAGPFGTFFVDPELGTDSPTCGGTSLATPVTGPCASLNQALANASAGAVIYIQKGGAFGPVFLSQQVSIVGPADQSATIVWSNTLPGCVGGAPGSCNGAAPALYAVDINNSTDSYKLKNLIVNNGGGSSGAMHIGGGGNVTLSHVILRGGSGAIPQMLLVNPNTGSQFQLVAAHCDIAFSTGGGILIQPQGSTTAAVQMVDTEVHHTKFGIKFDATMTSTQVAAAIDHSEFFSFNGSGIAAIATGAGTAQVSLARSTVHNAGGQGIQVNGANAAVNLYQDVITGNAIGVNLQDATATGNTTGTNTIRGNGIQCQVGGSAMSCLSALTFLDTD